MDSGRGITGDGSGYDAILAHAGGVLYGTELGSVTLKSVELVYFVFQLNTQHTQGELLHHENLWADVLQVAA